MKLVSKLPPNLIADFFLSKEDRTSPVWANLKERMEKKLAALREQNDNAKLTDVETARLRGHIECLKGIILLGKEPPEMTATVARPGPRPDYGAKYG